MSVLGWPDYDHAVDKSSSRKTISCFDGKPKLFWMPWCIVIQKLNFPRLVKKLAQFQMLWLYIWSTVRCPFVLVTSARQVIIRNSPRLLR